MFKRKRSRLTQTWLALLLPLTVAGAALVDGSWSLPDDGKGLTQHYGFWAYFITTPVILALTWTLTDEFVRYIGNPSLYTVPPSSNDRQRLSSLVRIHVRSLRLQSWSKSIIAFAMMAMLLWWVVNVVETLRPEGVYGHDVLDAYRHPAGFYLAHIYTLFVFVDVYAQAIFLVLHVTISLIAVLRYLNRFDLLRVDFFHQDKCGGVSEFGRLNLLVLAIYANWFIVIYAMYLTHRHSYLVMELSLLACSILATAQSIVGVFFVHKLVDRKRRICLTEINSHLNAGLIAVSSNGKFPTDLLSLRNHILGVHSYPYSDGASVLMNVIRFAPALIAIGNIMIRVS
jgi:hypothetical protein